MRLIARLKRPSALTNCSPYILLTLLAIVAFPIDCLTQNPPSPALDSPLIPYGSVTASDIDAISTTNASLSLNIPLISYPQRGGLLHVGFFIGHKPPLVDTTGQGWGDGVGIFPDFGVRLDDNSVANVDYQTIVTPDNASHNLGRWTIGATGTVRTRDATGFLVIEPSPDLTQRTVIDRKGIRYSGPSLVLGLLEPTLIEDPNGNTMTPQYNLTCTNSGNQYQYPASFIDTMGRNIPFPPPYPYGCPSPTTDSSGCTGPLPTAAAYPWTLPGVSGGTYTIKICYAQVNSGGQQFIQSVVLPNGTAWTFQYDLANRYDLTEITFPTLGTISYGGWNPLPSTYCDTPSRSVGTRTVDAKDGTGPQQWSYSTACIPYNSLSPGGGGISFPTSFSRTIMDPQQNQTVVTLTELGTWGQYYESQTQHYQLINGAQTLLNTINTSYSYELDPQIKFSYVMNVVPSSVITSWPDGTSQKTTFQYDPGTTLDGSHILYGNLIQQSDYDSTAGPLLRQANTTYMAFSGPNSSSYLANNLLDFPYTVQIVDGSSQQAALTQYNYDESTPASSGIGTSQQHDLSPPNANYRGNRTSLLRWLNAGSLTCPNGHIAGTNSMVLSKFTFFDTGAPKTANDPCGNQSTYAYASTYWGAYLTTVTNALNQSTNIGYDFNTGRLISSTDANNQPTTYKYNDPLLRLTESDYPDGGKTTGTYNDTASPPNVVASELIYGSTSKIVQTNVNGLGRAVETVLTSDPQGTTYTVKVYDPLGRVGTVYNPTRCNPPTSACSESTWGSANRSYDALGRITSIVEQDGSIVNTSYSGKCTTVTDEAGRSRKSCVDGLGRITRMFEDPGGLNYETDYQYDALGNLLCAVQKGTDTTAFTTCAAAPASWRPRSFTYNSLSRLLCAANPEVESVKCPTSPTGPFPFGAITYTYDPGGNLVTKMAPSPNQPSAGTATVTTTYTYDALNRLTGKSYTDGYTQNPTTPTVTYGYDGVVPSGCTPPTIVSPFNSGIPITPTNQVGRRSSMCDGSGATAWVYDPMGRPTIEERKLNGITKNIGYTYYLDGEQKYIWYASDDRMAFDVSAAGRVLGVEDGTDNYVYDNATYTPGGQLASMAQYARSGSNSVGFGTTFFYNKRLQPMVSWADYTPGGTLTFLFQRCYDYHVGGGVSFTDGTLNCSFSGTSPGDNGNLYQVQNKLDDTRTQNFTYDSLNRINQAYTNGSHWGQQFTIDAWGNLTAVGAVSGKTPVGVFTATASTNNQLSCTAGCASSYDAAGNMLTDGNGGITYDAENRIRTAGGVIYTYDGDGKRVEKSNGTLYWTGVGSDTLSESDLSGNINKEYIFFDGMRASRIDRPSNTVHSFLLDHLDSTRMMVVPASATMLTVEEDVDYTPYGIVATGTAADAHQFNGKERDSESGLDNFGARYNASSLGRYMTPDPLMASAHASDPQTWNRYSYALNNPLRYIDPTGMENCDSKDTKCIHVKLNVIYDKNANNGKGLTDKQKQQFEKDQLKAAQNEYKNSHIALDVTYTAGSLNRDSSGFVTGVTGVEKGAVNVLVTDYAPLEWKQAFGKDAVSFMNKSGWELTTLGMAGDVSKDDLGHELSHVFEEDLTSTAGVIKNVMFDFINDLDRSYMNTAGGYYYNRDTGRVDYANPFEHGARQYQVPPTQEAITPKQ